MDQFLRRAPFHDGLDKSPDFRLVAECELDDLPMDTPTNVQRKMLSIKYLVLSHPIPNLCDNMRLLAVYKSVGKVPAEIKRVLETDVNSWNRESRCATRENATLAGLSSRDGHGM